MAYLRPDGTHNGIRWHSYRGMSAHPFSPQGFGQSGESKHAPVDFPCARMGRKNHLGKRIPFTELPEDCRKLVVQDLTPNPTARRHREDGPKVGWKLEPRND